MVMDASLARGHANMFLRSLPTTDALSEWWFGECRRKTVVKALNECWNRKYIDRTVRRLRSNLPDFFYDIDLPYWDATASIGTAAAITATQNARLMAEVDAEETLFSETAVEFSRLMMHRDDQSTNLMVLPSAMISVHAVQRMLQRGAARPERLFKDVQHALLLADHIAYRSAEVLKTKARRPLAFHLPFRDGALAMVMCPHRNAFGEAQSDKGADGFIGAIRTFLPASMLNPGDKRRMETLRSEFTGLKLRDLRGPIFFREEEGFDARIERWKQFLHQVSVPWELSRRSDRVCADQGLRRQMEPVAA